ncbi:MAG: DnaA regulatory inactivator Hda, partial [Gammaproteobacteria bacterium]|nr:DnaA regulatory inactivator Hda [Gammaproteobacteria bacterium]
MMIESAQLPLAVHLRDEATLDNFLFPEALLPLRTSLESQHEPEGEPGIYLHGGHGSGRSHLLQAACHAQAGGEALYLPLEQLCELVAEEVLADIEGLALICLDNLDAIAGRASWEEALFHLINRARMSRCRLLFGAVSAPRRLGIELADLESRLSWAVVFHLPEPADAEKLRILQFRASRRGMTLSDEAAQYIFNRASRSLGELIALLEQLDRASM